LLGLLFSDVVVLVFPVRWSFFRRPFFFLVFILQPNVDSKEFGFPVVAESKQHVITVASFSHVLSPCLFTFLAPKGRTYQDSLPLDLPPPFSISFDHCSNDV